MRRSFRKLTPVLWAVAVALIGVRTTGAHLHLCLDGSEPFASVRAADTEAAVADHGAQSQGTHHDHDVEAVGTATFAKKDAQDDTATVADVVQAVVALAPPPQSVRGEPEPQSLAPRLPDLFRPLLRGPPA